MDLKLDREAVQDLIIRGFKADRSFVVVEDLQPGYARVRVPLRGWMVRPGDVISGPALFTAADLAMYALVLGHVGPQMMAVTSDFTMHFLNKGRVADVIATARLLKLGRRLVVMDVSLSCGDDPTIVAHTTGSYALPAKP
jgi:acyl-coenzyme A thioesterase PaaI-like protein